MSLYTAYIQRGHKFDKHQRCCILFTLNVLGIAAMYKIYRTDVGLLGFLKYM